MKELFYLCVGIVVSWIVVMVLVVCMFCNKDINITLYQIKEAEQMEYNGKNYRVTFTYTCKQCQGVTFVDPDKNPAINLDKEFIRFAVDGGHPVPMQDHHLTHRCSERTSHNGARIAPMDFTCADILEVPKQVPEPGTEVGKE